MKKIETLWHHILYEALTRKQFKFTQQELAQRYGYSLSTVHHAIAVPASIGAIRKESKFFVLERVMKLLLYWGSVRNLRRSIIYQTHSPLSVREREGLIPPTAVFACYSAARKILREPPADYDRVYVYDDAASLDEYRRRFPPASGKQPNVFVLRAHSAMRLHGTVTTVAQTFVDIWGLPDWYSEDFTRVLEEKIRGLL